MTLSVIIPVYRVEATLERCLKSVVAQGLDDMEVILVDDGSPDRSGKICDEWASHPLRSAQRDACQSKKGGPLGAFRVIHRENGGLSAARNSGLEVATGEYFTFVDSDDYLSPDTYGPLMAELEQHPEWDMVEFPVYRFYGSKRQLMLSFPPKVYTDMGQYWYEAQAHSHCYAWNKIFRRNLFNDVRFPEGRVFEDTWTLPRMLEHAKCVATTDKGLYYYCDNPQGITRTADGMATKSLLEAHLAAMRQFPLGTDVQSDIYYINVVNTQIMVCWLLGERPSVPQRRVHHLRAFSGMAKAKAIMNNYFGLNILCKTFRMIYHFTKPRL